MKDIELYKALSAFLTWYEDNMGGEDWLRDCEVSEDNPNGHKWVSYLDLPEYRAAADALDDFRERIKDIYS